MLSQLFFLRNCCFSSQRAPSFRVVLGHGGLLQGCPHLYLGQDVDKAHVPQTDKRLPPHLEIHRLQCSRAQDAPVALCFGRCVVVVGVVIFVCRCVFLFCSSSCGRALT